MLSIRSTSRVGLLSLFVLTVDVARLPAPSKPGADPIAGSARSLYDIVKGDALAAAEAMPESAYAFKPQPDVRTLGQQVAFSGAADTNLGEEAKFAVGPNARTVSSAFLLNLTFFHAAQHYGAITIYLRLKDIVPQSTQRLAALDLRCLEDPWNQRHS